MCGWFSVCLSVNICLYACEFSWFLVYSIHDKKYHPATNAHILTSTHAHTHTQRGWLCPQITSFHICNPQQKKSMPFFVFCRTCRNHLRLFFPYLSLNNHRSELPLFSDKMLCVRVCEWAHSGQYKIVAKLLIYSLLWPVCRLWMCTKLANRKWPKVRPVNFNTMVIYNE